ILLSVEFMVRLWIVPCGTASWTFICGAAVCVGPMIKLPSASGDGTSPSGTSLAVTNPGALGSRVGGGVRPGRFAAGGAGSVVWATAQLVIVMTASETAIRMSLVCIGYSRCARM